MNRLWLSFVSCGVAMLLLGESSNVFAAQTRPNIVFIIADDLRFDLLGCNGHPYVKTPHIDRLAAEGANFVNCFSTTPLCSPSRANFLTGLHTHKHRIVNNDGQGLHVLSHRLMTFPRILREEADYVTGYIGKWHMGFDDTRRPGFDHWISFKGQGQFVDPVVNINGKRTQTDGYLTDLISDWGVEFVEQNHDRPFCLFLSHEAVHFPFLPAERHHNLYSDIDIPVPVVDLESLRGKLALTRKLPKESSPIWFELLDASPERAEPRRGRPNDLETVIRDQLRCLAAVDEGVGRLYEVLKRKGILDETIVIFTSDQGYLHGEYGLIRQKRWPYDPSLRIPLVVRYPELIKAKTSVDEMVLSLDIAPTLLDLAGVKWDTAFDGHSLVSKLNNPQAQWRKSFLFEYFLEKITPHCPTYFGVRTIDWKFVHYPDLEQMDELYHLAEDPNERINLIDDPAHGPILARMKDELMRLNRTTQNPFAMSLR